jgi:WD40 repeat protein
MKESETYTFRYSSSFALATHPFEGYFLIADMAKINYVNESTGEIVRTFKPLGNSILNLAYDQIGNYLVSSGVNVSLKIWDLEQNKIARSIQGFWPIAFSPGGRELVSMYHGIALAVWDPNTGAKIHTLDTENELIQNIAYSKDGSMLAGAGFMGVVKLWDMETHELIKKFTGHVGGIYGTCFSPDGKLLASCGMDQTVRIWNVTSGKEIKKIEGHEIIVSDVKFSPDGKYIATASWDKTVKIWKTSDWSLLHTLEGHTNMITTIDFSVDGRFLASGAGNNAVAEYDNSVIIWDVEKGIQHCKYTGHRGMVQKVIFDRLSNYVFSTGDDGTIKVWDYDKCEEIATMASVGDDEYVIATPDNYYMSSKDALDAVSFRVKNKLYPFEQFDLKLNRPDIISSRLGKTPQGLVNAYQYIYQKRLRKMGFTEEQLGDDFHLPEVEIINNSKTLTTENKTFKFQAFLKDDKYKLDRINVYVNNVPIYGMSGFDLKELAVQSVKKDIEIELSSGVNKIQVSTHNEKGVESLRETFKIIYNGEVKKGDLYIISIGVSEYMNSQFNLKYAAKDAKDVIETITGKSTHLYKSIKQRLLTDEEVTKINIKALTEFVRHAQPEDAVIIFVAGHGLLDSNLDYYYATHNVDFNDPSQEGVSYELLESLLSITKAYEKLLIMDTCHSGELDKEEVEEGKNADVNLGEVEFRAVGVSVREKEGFGMENTKELMDEMFTDVRKGTGATVISSAGGAEFAMESSEWKNGLFTYCLLEGLTSKAADANHDGEIKISELRDYVYAQVTKLSNGKQKPTARSENLSVDYRIW